MLDEEKELLKKALDSINGVSFDLGNKNDYFTNLGKIIYFKRFFAELLELNLNQYLFPGESEIDEETDLEDYLKFSFYEENNKPISLKTKKQIYTDILPLISCGGITDSDDACIRCAKRIIAEVIGVPDLSYFRLMMEKELRPLYYKKYNPTDLIDFLISK